MPRPLRHLCSRTGSMQSPQITPSIKGIQSTVSSEPQSKYKLGPEPVRLGGEWMFPPNLQDGHWSLQGHITMGSLTVFQKLSTGARLKAVRV